MAWYTMDSSDISGGQVLDMSENSNHCTINGAVTAQGHIHESLSFDGDDYLDCGNDPVLDLTDAITIAAWVNPRVLETAAMALMMQEKHDEATASR